MRREGRIEAGAYVPVDYHQFTQGPLLRRARRLAEIAARPFVEPLAMAARRSDFVFRSGSELLSTVPYLFGAVAREVYYRRTLTRCGRNVSIGFGTIFYYRDVCLGDDVLIGNYNLVHYCDFGSYVMTADGCHFLSGSHYHNDERTDVPMALQGGRLRRIRVGDDTWIGAGAIVMDDVGEGAVVGAGAVVTAPVEPYTVVAGSPATLVRRRR